LHSLILTFLLTVIVLYQFAVMLSFGGGENQMLDSLASPAFCTTLLECSVSVITFGLRHGDLNQITAERLAAPATDFIGEPTYYDNMHGPGVFFVLIFYIIVGVILLNVVFGIIIDAFAALRQADAARKEHMQNTCFICGLHRNTLETRLKDQNAFQNHIDSSHDMWAYLCLIVSVRSKDELDLTWLESHVANQLENRPPAFFPRNTTLALQQAAREEQREAQRNADRELKMAEDITSTKAAVSEMYKALEELRQQVADKQVTDKQVAAAPLPSQQ